MPNGVPPSSSPPHPCWSPPRELAVLVVEDNATNRLLLRAMLRRGPVVLTEATGGLEAMDAAAARRFEVLLTDLSMPGMDGPEATRRIRAGLGARVGAHVDRGGDGARGPRHPGARLRGIPPPGAACRLG